MKVQVTTIALYAVLSFFSLKTTAQVEFKVSPHVIILNDFTSALEVKAGKNFGVEGTLGYNFRRHRSDGRPNATGIIGSDYYNKVYRIGLNGRYYFSPSKGLNGFYSGLYMRHSGGKLKFDYTDPRETAVKRLKLGIITGYKGILSNEKIVLDINFGLGRLLIDQYTPARTFDEFVVFEGTDVVDVFFNVLVGFRFGGDVKK
jgi:hypothetical protein